VVQVAVLDDYQDVARRMADWGALPPGTEVQVFRDHLAEEDAVAERLRDFQVAVAMRERTPFPRSLFARLPALRLLVTTGMRNASIDLAAAADGAALVSKEDLLRRSDVLTIHLVLSDRTRGLLGAPELALLRPTAYLINTSRGPIVDEGALVDALRRGAFAGAGLDVYDREPLPPGHPLLSLPTTVLTPHLGYVTRETYRVFFGEAIEDIAAFLAGTPLRVLTPSA
jgi:phosphoglycerate dehydrogenase-like enzyme